MAEKPKRPGGLLGDIIHMPGLVPVAVLILLTATIAHWAPDNQSCYPATFAVNVSADGAAAPVRVDPEAQKVETTLQFNKSRSQFTNGTGSLNLSIRISRTDVGTQDAVATVGGPHISPALWTWVKDDGRRFDNYTSVLVQGGGEGHVSLQIVYQTQRPSERDDDILFVDIFKIACSNWALFTQLRLE